MLVREKPEMRASECIGPLCHDVNETVMVRTSRLSQHLWEGLRVSLYLHTAHKNLDLKKIEAGREILA